MVRVSHHLLQSWILIQKSVVHCLMCWTNHRKKALQCSGQEFWKNHVCEQLRGLEVKCITFPQAMQVAKKWCFSLINSINHNAAAAILEQQQLYFMEMLKNTASHNAALGGCKHLDYLTASWMLLPMWRSWSGWGHLVAAAAMNILVQGVIPTTNHLESFNTILKQKHLAAWLHSGHWLRFDLLIHILITCILPGIYSCQRTQQEYSDWLCSHFLDKTGGQNLSKLHKQGMEEMWQENLSSLSWWQLDAKCDQEAAAIVQLKMLMISWGEDNASFKVTCTSSKANVFYPSHLWYFFIHHSGISVYGCLYFCNQGGACKHLQALHIHIDYWVQSGMETTFTFPMSLADAQQIQAYTSSAPQPPTMDSTDCSTVLNLSMLQALANNPTTLDQVESSMHSEESDLDLGCNSEADDFLVS